MTNTCRIRFCENQKIENYTVTSEDGSFPFTNALDTIRSKLYKATSNTDWRLTLDLGFADLINTLSIFGPLGQPLGITRDATVRLQADNVNDWTSPELDILITPDSDQQLIHFTEEDNYYRYWSLYIDDPGNPDFINFGYIYLGDYLYPQFRNIGNEFEWRTVDPTAVTKSLNGTAFFDIQQEYDVFSGVNFLLAPDSDRKLVNDIYDRLKKHTPFVVALDPGSFVTSDINSLTRLARFSSNFTSSHEVKGYYNMSFVLEEVI